MRFGIATKIAILTVVLVMATGASVAVLFYRGTNSILVEKELEALEKELVLQSMQMTSTINTLVEDVRFLSLTPPIQGIIRAKKGGGFDVLGNSSGKIWRIRLETIFSEFITAKPHYLQLRYIGVEGNGKEIVRVEPIGNDVKVMPRNELQSKGDAVYFKETVKLKSSEMYLSDIELNRERGKVVKPHLPVLRAAVPVHAPNGGIFGIVIINLDFRTTLERIQTFAHENYLTNDQGDYLVNPDRSKSFGFDFGQRYLVQEDFPVLADAFLPLNEDDSVMIVPEDKKEGSVVHLLKVFFDPGRPGRFLGIVQTVPFAEVVAESSNVFSKSAFLTLVLISLAAGLAVLISRIIVRPLLSITQAAGEVAKGNLDVQLSVKTGDEIGFLASSFKIMVGELKQRSEELKRANLELERRVEERTGELMESKTRIQAVVENIVDGIITIDEKGAVSAFNKSAEKIFGYDAEEVIGKNIKMLMPEPYHGEHDGYLKNFLKTSKAKVIGIGREVRGKRKDGGVFPIYLGVSEMWFGEKRMFTGVVRDITKAKKAEEEIQQARKAAEFAARELKNSLLVSEELREDAQNAKEEAEKYAEDAQAANVAKSDFLASMSHEIRTPMNAIIGMAELLEETRLTGEQMKYIRVFKGAGETLLSLINDILDISKVESGQLTLESVEFDLVEVVKDTVEFMTVRAKEKNLEIACRTSPETPSFLKGDPTRLRQIFVNLIGNAIKFTEKGEVIINVEKDRESDQPGAVRFSVSDTGIGIPKDKMERIFERFMQADSSTTRKYGGTGLGLSITKKLVEYMNGEMSVESEVGKGSTFSFTAVFEVLKEKRTPILTTSVELKGLKVLVIDDVEANRVIFKETLELIGMSVDVAENGSDGVKMMEKAVEAGGGYKLLLLDYHMPEMDGIEVLKKVRAHENLKDIGVLMLVSDIETRGAEKMRGLGVSYLMKPVKRAELIKNISVLLGVKPAIKKEPAETKRRADHKETKPLRILLVEDNKDNRMLALAYMKKMPYTVDIAENGQVAFEKFKSAEYDLVLMDVQMPVMDGYTATREIRKWEKDMDMEPVPVIALTAHALKEDEQKSMDAGCDGHLTKPIKKAALLDSISKYTS